MLIKYIPHKLKHPYVKYIQYTLSHPYVKYIACKLPHHYVKYINYETTIDSLKQFSSEKTGIEIEIDLSVNVIKNIFIFALWINQQTSGRHY
jgi:hypothetical protein